MTSPVDLAGCTHIHSRYTDGSYRYDEILDSARKAGLDFVLMTDHDNLDALRDGWPGRHEGVLCIVGVEITARGGHLIAAQIADCEGLRHAPIAHALEAVARQGGVGFAAHPMGKVKHAFNIRVGAWEAWGSPLFAGFELWCYMHDWIHDLRLGNFRRFVREPDAVIKGPDAELLTIWDKMLARRRLSAIGALDNHARNLPFHRFGRPIWTILPHEYVFRTVRTHVLVEPPTGDAARDTAAVLAAMASGSCYVSYDLHADPRGFEFVGRRGEQTLRMGDEVPSGPEIEFEMRVPRACALRIICGGREVARGEGDRLGFVLSAGEVGAVRAEARLDGRPWIFSNPIHVKKA